MTEQYASWIVVGSGASASALTFSPHRLTVFAVHGGALRAADVSSFADRVKSAGVQQALQRRNFAGEGLTRGSQFKFWVRTGEKEDYAFGFLEDTPAEFQSLIGDLLKLEKSLPSEPVAEAYLRGVPLQPNRRQPKARIQQLSAMTPEQQEPLQRAIRRPFAFEPISRQLESELLKLADGRDLFVADTSGGHQLTLYDVAEHP